MVLGINAGVMVFCSALVLESWLAVLPGCDAMCWCLCGRALLIGQCWIFLVCSWRDVLVTGRSDVVVRTVLGIFAGVMVLCVGAWVEGVISKALLGIVAGLVVPR
jgi:hypothetical protein